MSLGFLYFKGVEKEDVFISQGRRPMWHKVLAALSFTILMYSVYEGIMEMKEGYAPMLWIYLGVTMLFLGLRFSMTRNFYFNFDSKQFREEFQIGSLKMGAWEPLPELEYISVFNTKGIYEINVWFKPNDFYNLGASDDLETALEQGKRIAKKLHIDLLDAATDPRDSKWIDL